MCWGSDVKAEDCGCYPSCELCNCYAVTEGKDTHCSDKCCGSDVKAEDCGCKPTCEHCNCNDPKVDEGKYKNDAQRKAVHASKNEKKKNESYKESLASRLSEKVSTCCSDCGKDSYTTLNLSLIHI